MSNLKPTTIYIDPDDDVAEVVRQILAAKSNQVVLTLPHRALVLQSLTSLKMIKLASAEGDKTISIATSDTLGIYLAKAAEIVVESEIEEPPRQESLASDQLSLEEEAEISPAPVAEIPQGRSINPLTGFRLKQLAPEPSAEEEDKELPIMSLAATLPRLKLPRISWKLERHHRLALWLGGAGAVMLLAVAGFVLHRAYVALEVQSQPFKKQFTLTLADEQDLQAAGPNILPGRFIEVTREHVATFTAGGEQNKGEPSRGQLNIVNHTNGIQGILANTRFVTSNGLVFRISSEILVPPARGGTPGRAVVEAVSEGGGTNYNISAPMQLTIPNISESLKPLLYGEVVGSFSGGTDNIVKVVSQEDIDRGKEEAAKNVFVAAEAELSKQAKRTEELNPAFIQNDVIDAVPSVTPGAEQEEFEIRVQSRSWTLLTPKGKFPESLSNAATFEVAPDQQVTDQTLRNAQVEPLESNFITHRISLLVTLDGRVGPRLNTSEILTNLRYSPIDQAQNYLQNLANVASSSVEVWPTFMNRLPFLANKINLQVIYLGE